MKGTYSTDFATEMAQVDATFFNAPIFASWVTKDRLRKLHDFTHGGVEQLLRQSKGSDVIANYSEKELRGALDLGTFFAFMTTFLTADFLGYFLEVRVAGEMFKQFAAAPATLEWQSEKASP